MRQTRRQERNHAYEMQRNAADWRRSPAGLSFRPLEEVRAYDPRRERELLEELQGSFCHRCGHRVQPDAFGAVAASCCEGCDRILRAGHRPDEAYRAQLRPHNPAADPRGWYA